MEQLTSVHVVIQSQPKLQELSHVLRSIDAFAGAPALWSLEIAASRGLLHLLDHRAAREPSVVHSALGSRRFLQGTQSAVACGQLDVLKWWTTRYLPGHSLEGQELVALIIVRLTGTLSSRVTGSDPRPSASVPLAS